MFKWLRNCFFWRPTAAYALLYHRAAVSKLAFPFSNAKCFAVEGYFACVSFVGVLLLRCGPPAIFRAVAKTVIVSIKGTVCWWIAHVGVEVFKRHPPRAHSDPPASVVLIIIGRWIEATIFHGVPYRICAAIGHSVCAGSLHQLFHRMAAARYGAAGSEIAPEHSSDCAARTLAFPQDVLLMLTHVFNYGKTTEGNAKKVFHSALLNVAHRKELWQALVLMLFGSYPSQKIKYSTQLTHGLHAAF